MAMTVTDPLAEDRPMKPALWNGWRRRCPKCGQGHVFTGYLKLATECPVCHEDLSHQRADDGPAYATILIVGHLMAPLLMWVFVEFRPSPVTLSAVFTLGCVSLSLFLLPRLKGMFVAVQWAKRMHGFGGADD